MYLNLSVMLGNYLQLMSSADNIFRCIVSCTLRANAFLANSNFCHLLKTFENSLDQIFGPNSVGPDLDPNKPNDFVIVFLNEFSEKKNHFVKS